MQRMKFPGVPRALREDAWWMAADRAAGGAGRDMETAPPIRFGAALPALIALVVWADWLLWDRAPGLGVALLGLSLVIAAIVLSDEADPHDLSWGLGIGVLAVLPLVETVQALSVGFFLVGVPLALLIICLGTARLGQIGGALLRFPMAAIFQMLRDVEALGPLARGQGVQAAALKDWILPGAVGTVFLCLLFLANPLIETALNDVDMWVANALDAPRIAFWGLMAVMIWPALRLTPMRDRLLRRFIRARRLPKTGLMSINAVRNAMVTFNLIFAVQTVTDLSILWGGAALPDGMTYAEYAHRGAYPLVLTALLAGAFAVMARPYLSEDWVRWLMYLWLAQNLLLVASSVFRLELYVQTYGLTYLRIHAGIWMALVALGLASVIGMIATERSVGWMLGVNGAALVAVLYGASFVNFAGLIAQHNLAPDFKGKVDRWYLCQLPEGAFPAIHAWEQRTGHRTWPGGVASHVTAPKDWREWGFRNARIRAYFEAQERELYP